MTHNEIISCWELCSEIIEHHNLVCERFIERFKLHDKKGKLLYTCKDVNELRGFLICFDYKSFHPLGMIM